MKKEIIELQKLMYEEGIDVYYVPESDPHGSEDVNRHFKTCEFLSGLLAENEELVVTEDSAYIWTDSRFFLQAERELAGSGIRLMKMKEEGVATVNEFLKDMIVKFGKTHDTDDFVIGFDGRTMPASKGRSFEDDLGSDLLPFDPDAKYGRVRFKTDEDLGDKVWTERPELVPSKLWELPLSSTGKTAAEKVTEIRMKMAEKDADWLLLTDLTETAWLLNLRGADISHTPVFYSFILLGKDSVRLYVMNGALDELAAQHKTRNGLPDSLNFVEVREYDDIYTDIASVGKGERIWMDPDTVNYELWTGVPEGTDIIDESTPAALAKSVKNETEIACTRNAHIKDGIAVTRFIKWLKDLAKTPDEEGYLVVPESGRRLTEISAADYLEARRREQDGCFDLSFGTISGYGPNGAIVHYAPKPETDFEIKAEGFLLVDSGGQYIDGTTDITRTIAVGPLTQQMIDNYTYVLKGHIALSRFVITPDTVNKELDEASREALRSVGLDFGHGVSHGVGHVLAVHEGPAGVRRDDKPCVLVPGMIISNEPGYYEAGEYGIRIENEILMKAGSESDMKADSECKSETGMVAGSKEGLCVNKQGKPDAIISEPITCVPYERAAINKSLLTDEEIAWIDSYHAWVRSELTPLVDEETAAFIAEETRPLA